MGVITRIEVKNFRSINHLILDDLDSDINIFVGKNDIGKSNILRALNLFFKGETDIGSPIKFSEDFNKNIKRTSGKGQYIKIVICIKLKYEIKKYVRWTKKWDNEGRLSETKEVFDDSNVLSDFVDKSRAKGWLERLTYQYVPAIKSPLYFEYLFEELHDLMSTTYSSQFKQNTAALISSIQSLTQEITDELMEVISLENKISLPADLKAFFRALDFSLEKEGLRFNLKSRGDGIKARHIPVVLKFMASKAKLYKRGALDIQTIWGFEEPENNLEMSHAFDMASKFLEYSTKIQIFLTTHSPAFYSLKENQNRVTCWFVDRDVDGFTICTNVNKSPVDLDEKMGMLAFVTPFIKEKDAQIKQHGLDKEELSREIERLKDSTKVVVFTEDESDGLAMIKTYIKLHGFNEKETEYYSYYGKDNFNGALIAADTFLKKNPKIEAIIFHRDMDVDGEHFITRYQSRLSSHGRKNYYLLMPKGYDLESEFINAEHINHLYNNLSIEVINELIDESTKEAESTSLEKLKNVYLKVKIKDQIAQGIKLDDIKYNNLYKEVDQMYFTKVERYRYGKKVIGILIAKLQKSTGRRVDVFKPTEFIKKTELVSIAQKIWP